MSRKTLAQRWLFKGALLFKIKYLPQSRRGRRGVIFLFGGERPPNKKLLSCKKTHYSQPHCEETRLWINPRRARVYDPIAVSQRDRIIRTFPQRSLRLGGEPGFSQSTFEFKKPMKPMKPIGPLWPFAYLAQQWSAVFKFNVKTLVFRDQAWSSC